MQVLEKVEKEVRFSSVRQRGNVSVVREHYLRDDIGCKVDSCPLCTDCKVGGDKRCKGKQKGIFVLSANSCPRIRVARRQLLALHYARCLGTQRLLGNI